MEKELPATTKNKGMVMNHIRRAKKGPGAEAREEASVGKLIRCSIAIVLRPLLIGCRLVVAVARWGGGLGGF